jgi:hypothetical protein
VNSFGDVAEPELRSLCRYWAGFPRLVQRSDVRRCGFLLNYIPFIGAVAGICLVAIASLIQFENIGYTYLEV